MQLLGSAVQALVTCFVFGTLDLHGTKFVVADCSLWAYSICLYVYIYVQTDMYMYIYLSIYIYLCKRHVFL